MDPLEKDICLRIINKVTETLEQINIDAPKKIEPLTDQVNSFSLSSCLLNAKKELKSGNLIKLCTIIDYVRQYLSSCLKGLGPYLTVFCGAIYIEQILNEEILKLPRKLRYNYSNRRNKVTKKRKGAGNNMFLHSSILRDTLKDINSRTLYSSKDGCKMEKIGNKEKKPKSKIRELEISSESLKNGIENKRDMPEIARRASRKREKSVIERVSLVNVKKSSFTNSRYRTLRSGRKMLEVKKKGFKDSSKESDNNNQYPQDSKTERLTPLGDTIVSLKMEPPTPKQQCCTSATKMQKIMEPGKNSSVSKTQGSLYQTAASSEKSICLKFSDNGYDNMGMKIDKLSLDADCEIKQVTSQPDNQSFKKEHSKTQVMQCTVPNLGKIKRNLPLRGKRALNAMEYEKSSSSKKVKYSKIDGGTISPGLPKPIKKANRSNCMEERKTLSVSLDNKESMPKEAKYTMISDLGKTEDKGIYDFMDRSKTDRGKNFTNDVVESSSEEISSTDQSNGVNKTNLFEEIKDAGKQEKEEKDSHFFKSNASCPDSTSLPSFEQTSTNNAVLQAILEKPLSRECPIYTNKPNEEKAPDGKYANISLLSLDNDSLRNKNGFTRMIIECCHKDDHWKTSTLTSKDKYESLKHMPQVLEVSCFLHACQKVLHLPFFTHYEFEWAILIPQASQLMAAIMTALLNASPASTKETRCAVLPYLEWNRKLTARISHWFLIQQKIKSFAKVDNLIGTEPTFWEFIGTPRNPLSQRPFHQLTICQRVVIIKSLCDHLLHVSKRIQTAIMSTPNSGREAVSLGRDSRGNLFVFFPILLRHGKGDIRIYKMEEEYSLQGIKKQIQETIIEKDGKNSSHFHRENLVPCICKDRRFWLVADDIDSLDTLAEKMCSSHTEEEFHEAEKILSEKRKPEEKGEIHYKDEDQVNELEDIDDSDLLPSCEHLKLALNINLLAKNLWPYQQALKKSSAAAKTKLAAEWEEYSKDRLNAMWKGNTEQKTKTRSYATKNYVILKNTATAEASREGQKKTPTRVSLSRKVKSKMESPLSEIASTLSRREIVAKMEEDALMGRSSASEEEKWETNLWADEESEDEELSAEEDMDWTGYETMQNNSWMQTMDNNKKETKEEIVANKSRSNQMRLIEAAKTYNRIFVVKSVKDDKNKMTNSTATKDAEQPNRNIKAFNIISNPVSLSKNLVKGRYVILAEKFKTNTIQNMKNQNQDRFFGKLHFNITDEFEQLYSHPIWNYQDTKTESEEVVSQPSCAPGSVCRVKTHKELSNDLETKSKASEINGIEKQPGMKRSLESYHDDQMSKFSQSPRDEKQKNDKKEQCKLPNPENTADNGDGMSKPMNDEETRIFKPFPLQSMVLTTQIR